MNIKERVYTKCIEVVNERISYLESILKDLTHSASNETKSTAGDKHETALAMLQIEQENTSRQLQDAFQQKLQLEKIDITKKPLHVVNGCLVKTNKGFLFLSVALGKLSVDQTNFIALSANSPLGSKLLKLQVNHQVEMNGTVYFIEDIF